MRNKDSGFKVTQPSTRIDTYILGRLACYAPGVVLVAVITASAYGVGHLSPFAPLSPMILAIVIGLIFANIVGLSPRTSGGIGLAGKHLLRVAVALLGLQLTFAQLAELGIKGILFAVAALLLTFYFSLGLGRLLGIDRKLNLLLAAGTSVCGASAIAGANAVAKADDEDVCYAVACITLFGSIAMFLFPAFQDAFALEPQDFGYWVGLSVHEVGQVVAAGFQAGDVAGQSAVVAKLARVMLLAPLLTGLFLATTLSSSRLAGTQMVPWFIVVFLLFMMLNSGGLVAEEIRTPLVEATPLMLTAAMSALGLGADVTKIRKRGSRPLVVAGFSSAFIAALSLLLIKSLF
ncbi:YeiH family putative sulfate export transporter [Ensifer sp. ENS06]|uniref:YeiH family protein n=1 Tax=Ensifer sp. ENS06 TaxID=2769276 RepID=UPI001780A394|nr:YeiH family protein [Ensifer sp. ENS06]MBD9626957.1 YeiH family putative sulfate export transporter [Ensifer sp. ENS06]